MAAWRCAPGAILAHLAADAFEREAPRVSCSFGLRFGPCLSQDLNERHTSVHLHFMTAMSAPPAGSHHDNIARSDSYLSR
jgi:hypothetical protein